MKLTIRYEPEEIKTLIREDLVRQGITVAADAPIVFDAGPGADENVIAIIDVDAARVGTLSSSPPPVSPDLGPQPKMPLPPALEIVDGGANNGDMSDVLGASKKLVRGHDGLYPPSERTLMEGESHEFPGTPPRR